MGPKKSHHFVLPRTLPAVEIHGAWMVSLAINMVIPMEVAAQLWVFLLDITSWEIID